jgi:hypothetical protein
MPQGEVAMTMRAFVCAAVCALSLASAPCSAKDLRAMSADEVLSLQQRRLGATCYTGALDGQASGALEAAKKACPDQDPV